MRIVQKGQLAGEFNGWNGDAVFEFTNGNKWQQTRYKYKYKYKYRPYAKVLQDGSKYYLEVDCMDDTIEVRRL